MAEQTFKLKLNLRAALAAWMVLGKTQTKGETEIRANASCRRAHRAGCQEDDEEKTIKAGTMELAAEPKKYLRKVLRELMDAGLPGDVAEGIDDLLEALDEAEKSAKK